MPDESLRIPEQSYDQLRVIAERFLAEHHPAGTISVPVEEIIEFRLGGSSLEDGYFNLRSEILENHVWGVGSALRSVK